MYSPNLPPKLPPELEREIFELAAQSDPLFVLQLMLVAWRVHTWVKPILYRVILLLGTNAENACSFPSKDFSRYMSVPASVLRESVQHLCIRMAPENVTEDVLSTADNVENLWIATTLSDFREAALVAALPSVECLHCSSALILSAAAGTAPPMFSCLTPLEIFEPLDTEISRGLALIPNLTHFGFDDGYVEAVLLLGRVARDVQVCLS
ncbi:hypothetical protein FB45DRAFT_237806 [Roridomyces roridus]|uniref:Uncharacterized protein n=1 Tax=Roridomyces roridus TaxID=1738132 RepID=A0AAD7BB83_9AGAR|nr:hypothetical protein FB45DRAFT_237806 [Roridomyces roridus]